MKFLSIILPLVSVIPFAFVEVESGASVQGEEPTDAPTIPPAPTTHAPTNAPTTHAPTNLPTTAPTNSPTTAPTHLPTNAPTLPPCLTGSYDDIMEFCVALEGDSRCCVDQNDDVGPMACFWSGSDFTMCQRACWGQGSCSGITGNNAVFENNACRGQTTCNFIGSNDYPDAQKVFGAGSCHGTGACGLMGFKGDVIIQSGACFGDRSCNGLGKNANTTTVGSNACNGANACESVGTDAESVVVSSDACNGDSECEDCGADMDYATVVIDADSFCNATL